MCYRIVVRILIFERMKKFVRKSMMLLCLKWFLVSFCNLLRKGVVLMMMVVSRSVGVKCMVRV